MHDGALEDEHPEPLPPIGGSVFDAAEYTEPAKRLPVTVLEYYREALARRGFVADDSQYAAVQRLQRLYEQAQVIVKEEAPWITVAHSVRFDALRKEVRGYKMDATAHHFFNNAEVVSP